MAERLDVELMLPMVAQGALAIECRADDAPTRERLAAIDDREAMRLREYLLRGGFLHADDNYGLDEHFRREIAKVFPDRPLVDVPLDHPIYRIVYPFPQGIPKIHEHDGKPARGFGIFIVPSLDLVIYKLGGNNGQYEPSLTGLPQPPVTDTSRDNWKPLPRTPFSEGSLGGDDGLRRVLEMVCAAVRE